MSRFLYFVRKEPDVDHMIPLAWTCLEKGDAVVVVCARAFPHATDSRFRFLQRYPRFELLSLPGVESRRGAISLASQLLWPRARVRSLLRRLDIAACFFPWGKGYRLTTRTIGSHLRRPLRRSFIAAALDLRIPTFCVPSGLRVRVHRTTEGIHLLPRRPGKRPGDERSGFTVYVVTNDHHREWALGYYRENPAVFQNWGSLRFCPEWRRILKEMSPEVSLPAPRPGQARVLMFLPKWAPFIDRTATVRLVRELATRENVQLLIKTHPDRGLAQLADLGQDLAARPNVVLVGNAGSLRLIEAADTAVLVHSSIGIEVLLQRKPLIHASYLHSNQTMFDQQAGCLVAQSLDDVYTAVDRIARGGPPAVDEAAFEALSRDVVYGGREPFNVPEYYYDRIQEFVGLSRPRIEAAR